ncbi:beta propeller repeat protein [Plantactinospora veratri]
MPDNSLVDLRAVGPRTLVAEVQTMPKRDDGMIEADRIRQFWLASTDGGINWREIEITEAPAVPETYRPVEWIPEPDGLTVLAADPATGEVVRLAEKLPLHHARVIEGGTAAGGLWVTGWTDRTIGSRQEENGTVSENVAIYSGSAIRISWDGGRNWRQSVLPEEVEAGGDAGASALAVGDQVAYAVGQVDGELRVYRSVDQGRNWQRTAARAQVGDRMIHAAVRPDGVLLIQAGILAGENPMMFEGLDRGERLREIPVGPGASAVAVPGGYAQTGNQDSSGGWLSPDGITWSYVGPPTIKR